MKKMGFDNKKYLHMQEKAMMGFIAVPDNIHLLPENIIASIWKLKKEVYAAKNVNMDLEETLIALSISATNNPVAFVTLEELKDFNGCETHLTHIPTPGDDAGLRKLGLNITSDPDFATRCLFLG